MAEPCRVPWTLRWSELGQGLQAREVEDSSGPGSGPRRGGESNRHEGPESRESRRTPTSGPGNELEESATASQKQRDVRAPRPADPRGLHPHHTWSGALPAPPHTALSCSPATPRGHHLPRGPCSRPQSNPGTLHHPSGANAVRVGL